LSAGPERSKYANNTKRAWYYPDTQEKVCAKCGVKTHINNFFKHKQTKDGYHSWCKSCCKEGNQRSRTKKYSSFEGRVSTFLSSCRKNAEKRKHECSITAKNLTDAWQTQNGICAYTGFEMTTAPGRYNSVSVERINNSIGYTAENTILVCNIVNRMKSDIPGEVFFDVCRAVVRHLGDLDGNLDVDFCK
jgi:hypothetical protein